MIRLIACGGWAGMVVVAGWLLATEATAAHRHQPGITLTADCCTTPANSAYGAPSGGVWNSWGQSYQQSGVDVTLADADDADYSSAAGTSYPSGGPSYGNQTYDNTVSSPYGSAFGDYDDDDDSYDYRPYRGGIPMAPNPVAVAIRAQQYVLPTVGNSPYNGTYPASFYAETMGYVPARFVAPGNPAVGTLAPSNGSTSWPSWSGSPLSSRPGYHTPITPAVGGVFVPY